MAEQNEYAIHPLALIFPMMTDAELAELAEDIKLNGQVEPIALYDGKILDGRNRYRACQMAGVEPRATVLEGLESPTVYVISRNLHRRHLTPGQRSAIGAEIAPMLEQEALERKRQGGALAGRGRPKAEKDVVNLPHPYSANDSNELHGRSRDIAGKALGVSGSSVARAAAVKKADPNLFDQIKRGEVAVNTAYNQVKEKERAAMTPSQQQDKPEAVALSKRDEVRANSAKRKMMAALGEMKTISGFVTTLKVSAIRSVCSPDELAHWAHIAKNSVRNLRVFISRLKEGK